MTPETKKPYGKVQVQPAQRSSTTAQDRLRDLAFRANALAASLSTEGEHLSDEQLMLLHMANLPVLRDAFQTATMEYLSGVPRSQILDNLSLNIQDI